jgi:ERCC4-type nuclease
MLPAEFRPEQVTAVVDTREQCPLDLSPLTTIRKTLVTGDCGILGLEGIVSIERKSLTDLVVCSGVERGRFGREVKRLQGYSVRALVVEATWEEGKAGRWRS